MKGFGKISSLAELEQAQAKIKRRLELQEQLIRAEAVSVKEAFTPSRAVRTGLSAVSRLIPFDRLAVIAFSSLGKRLMHRK
ncbi:MAG: hypothetical protein ACI4AE_05185 [Candidatus Cryptobacteroides sp.]